MSKCDFLLKSENTFDTLNSEVRALEYLVTNKHYKTLNVLSLGREKCTAGHSFSYAYTNFYLIHYVISGCGTFVKNKISRSVSAGEIFIIKPGSVYSYKADKSTPWEYMWFSFDGEIAEAFEKCDEVMKITDDTILFEMLDFAYPENAKTEYLTGKLYEFMAEIFDDGGGAFGRRDYVKTVSDFIKANYMRKISVSAIADTIGLDGRYLSRIFKREKGIAIQEYILKQKFSKAKKLLKMGVSVSETALTVGYGDQYAFSKMFKKHIGVSPSEYAKNILKNSKDVV